MLSTHRDVVRLPAQGAGARLIGATPRNDDADQT
jgi:hypothetical protein